MLVSIRKEIDLAQCIFDVCGIAKLKECASELPPRLLKRLLLALRGTYNEELLSEMCVFVQSFCGAAKGTFHCVWILDAEFAIHYYLVIRNYKAISSHRQLTLPVVSLLLCTTKLQSITLNQSIVRSIITGRSFSRWVTFGDCNFLFAKPVTDFD